MAVFVGEDSYVNIQNFMSAYAKTKINRGPTSVKIAPRS